MIKFVIVVFTLFCRVAFPVKHSLVFSLTAFSGVPDFPEYLGSALVDEVQVGYFDSNTKTAEPKVDWIRKLIKDDPQHLEWYVHKCIEHQHFFKATIDSLVKRLNQTGGVHILQQISGCEWDEENGDIRGFQQYGFNGEDFIALDLETLTWIAPNPLAFNTKLKWDTETARLEYNKYYYEHVYSAWLQKYVEYSRSFLKRTDLPSVSLLQKTPSSPVTCHATGFYLNRADLFWRKDGEELHEDVDKGEILPNHDETFQWSVLLQLSSIKPKDWRRYNCVFQLSGVKDIIIKLDKTVIKTNRDYYICKTLNETDTHITVAVVVFSIFLFAILIFIVCKILKDPSDQIQLPNNHLKYSSAAALVVAFILVVLNGILVHKNSEDLYISFPSDFMSKWGDSLPGKQLNL